MSLPTAVIKEICPRFRILVVGRRNAGKTTILKKMCGSDGSDLEIVNTKGEKVDPSVLEPNRQRGMSDIDNEITFKSSPLFVFHDSRGIEAGAGDEQTLHAAYLWNFLDKRSKAPRIRDQVHAVWFCIPMDNPRAPSAEFELAFFNARQSPVPVIAVFTKFESLVDGAYDDLPDDDSSDAEKEEQANEIAQTKFQATVLKAIQSTKCPPNQVVQLQRLNEVTTECAVLTEKTYGTVEDGTLSEVFALAQRNSFRIGSEQVFRRILLDKIHWMGRVGLDNRGMLHISIDQSRTYIPVWRSDALLPLRGVDLDDLDDFGESTGMITNVPHCLSIVIVTCIVLVSTAEKSRDPLTLVNHTIQLLQMRPDFAASITTSVRNAYSEFPEEAHLTKLVDRLVGIVMTNVDSLRA